VSEQDETPKGVAVSGMFYQPKPFIRTGPGDTFDGMRAAWLYGYPVIDSADLLYGQTYIATGWSGPTIIRGQRVPTVDEATPELIVRHGLHKVLRWLGEDTETPALRKARRKHEIKVVRMNDGTYRVVPRG